MSFQRNVLTIAIILFMCLLLLLIAVMMNSAKKNQHIHQNYQHVRIIGKY